MTHLRGIPGKYFYDALFWAFQTENSQYSYNAIAIKFLYSNCLVKRVVTGLIAR